MYNYYLYIFSPFTTDCVMRTAFICCHIAHAQNLDGGGSSVSVYNGEVISRPTCMDTPFVCERAVTSITCVSQLP